MTSSQSAYHFDKFPSNEMFAASCGIEVGAAGVIIAYIIKGLRLMYPFDDGVGINAASMAATAIRSGMDWHKVAAVVSHLSAGDSQ